MNGRESRFETGNRADVDEYSELVELQREHIKVLHELGEIRSRLKKLMEAK